MKAPRVKNVYTGGSMRPSLSASEHAYIIISSEAVRAKHSAHGAQATLAAERVLFTATDLTARGVRLETKRARHGAAAWTTRCRLWVALTRLVVNKNASEQLTVKRACTTKK